jgi:protocatechuate 3,4-dioxygenase beta subunit
MRRAATAVLFSIAASMAGSPPIDAQQNPPTPSGPTAQSDRVLSQTSVIHGRVYALATGDPIRNARVAIFIAGRPIPAVLTDTDGRFQFAVGSPAQYNLIASKPGFAKTALTVAAAAVSPAGVQALDSAVADEIQIGLAKAAVLAGVVLDDDGEPLPEANVVVEAVQPAAGRPAPSAQTVATTQTDDLGEFRFGGLAAGAYVVSVRTGEIVTVVGERFGTATIGNAPARRIYYPATSRIAEAQRFDLTPGDEKGGVAFTIPDWRPAASGLIALNAGRVPDDADPKTFAIVRGRVHRPDGRPLSGARVLLIPARLEGRSRMTVTGAGGAYEFAVPAEDEGEYRVIAGAVGYLEAPFGAPQGERLGQPVALHPGDVRERVDVTLLRPAIVVGRVVDEYGDPVDAAAVRALRARFADGRRQLVDAGVLRRTDDLGRFRLSGLRPGAYVIGASVGQIIGAQATADVPGYGTTYFPGTLDAAAAQLVPVGSPGALATADFALARTRTVRVAGSAFDAAGDPVSGGIALIPSYRSGSIGTAPLGARIEQDGRFEFSNVPAGDYVVQVVRRRPPSWNEGEFTAQYVSVTDRDVTDLALRASTGSTIAGRIDTDNGRRIALTELQLVAAPADFDRTPRIGGPPASARVGPDGSFDLTGISGPRRLTVTRAPEGWMLDSVVVAGVDVTDAPLPFGRAGDSLTGVGVVMTSTVSRVTGRVVDARGRPVSRSDVLVFSADRTRRYPLSRFMSRTASDDRGAFGTGPLPPGDYFVAAVDGGSSAVEGDNWQDPEFLDRLSRGATWVSIARGERVTLELRLANP